MQDDATGSLWWLAALRGQVSIRIPERGGESLLEIDIDDQAPLIFKLSGAMPDHGRRVRQPSLGSFLVVVPEGWERDEKVAGRPPITSEPVSLQGYRAHFFDLPDNSASAVAFRDALGRPSIVRCSGRTFELDGQQIHDASERLGPLFAGQPPQISAVNRRWADVGTIVLGEEGEGGDRWRTSFKPNLGQPTQEMPPELSRRAAGWYFLRFYDGSDDLIESLDFRFVAGLQGIDVPDLDPLPPPTGHQQAAIEFRHEVDCSVEAASADEGSLAVARAAGRTVVTIPPTPRYDRTCWRVGPPCGPRVSVEVLLERVWWAAGSASREPCQWEDRPLPLPHEDFTATSQRVIWIRLPALGWADTLSAGLGQSSFREYRPKVTEEALAVPLRHFSDAQELVDRTVEHLLTIELHVKGGTHRAVIARIPARQPERDLDLASISAPRLARALTVLYRANHGPLRQLLKTVRREYRKSGRSRRPPDADLEFVRKALCLIAIVVERPGSSRYSISRPLKCWQRKARLAATEFPETVGLLYSHCGKLRRRFSP
jgi:hypothetical protein